jgi:hypothetical protein
MCSCTARSQQKGPSPVCTPHLLTATHTTILYSQAAVSTLHPAGPPLLLQVTQCSSAAEALSRLSGSCSYDVLLADRPSIYSSSDLEQLLKAAEGLPCVFMASNPSAEDVMAGGPAQCAVQLLEVAATAVSAHVAVQLLQLCPRTCSLRALTQLCVAVCACGQCSSCSCVCACDP